MKTPAAFSPLQIALGVSVAVHAALLTVRFVNPEAFNRVFQDTPLEVVLVNAKSKSKPLKPQVLAQQFLFIRSSHKKASTLRATPRGATALRDAVATRPRRYVPPHHAHQDHHHNHPPRPSNPYPQLQRILFSER